MKTKTVYFLGGFGNNLYQLNIAYYLKKKGFDVKINTFLTHKNFLTRFLGWHIHQNINSMLLKEFEVDSKFNLLQLLKIFVSRYTRKTFYGCYFDLNKSSIVNFYNTDVFCGYWQHKNNLETDEISDFKKFLRLELLSNTVMNDYCIIHIRGNDLSLSDRLKFQYYTEALKKIKHNSAEVCTDDKKYASTVLENIPNLKYKFSSSRNAFEDWKKLASSSILIGTNSTFCVWAALLNENTVYLPKSVAKNLPSNISNRIIFL